MNEILQQRIEKAARLYADKAIHYIDDSEEDMIKVMVDFTEQMLSHQWISVEEALPKDEKYVFVKLSCGRLPWTAMYDYNRKSWVDVNHVSIHGVTHWMEIPEIGGEE